MDSLGFIYVDKIKNILDSTVMLIKLDETGNKIECEYEYIHEILGLDDTVVDTGCSGIPKIARKFIYCPYCGEKLENNESRSPDINNT